MIAAPLIVLSIVTTIAVSPIEETTAPLAMTTTQKRAALQPALQHATECVARAVATDMKARPSAELGDLIVDSMSICAGSMRAMIDAHDRYFGAGSGEAFFVGPYLELLPNAVDKLVHERRD